MCRRPFKATSNGCSSIRGTTSPKATSPRNTSCLAITSRPRVMPGKRSCSIRAAWHGMKTLLRLTLRCYISRKPATSSTSDFLESWMIPRCTPAFMHLLFCEATRTPCDRKWNGRLAKPAPRTRCLPCKQTRSEEHTSELQSRLHLVCRLLLEKKKHIPPPHTTTRSDLDHFTPQLSSPTSFILVHIQTRTAHVSRSLAG